jgi:hypothetical protein
MLNRLSEKKMHLVKWLLAIGWTGLILSLFYDPITPIFTDPSSLSSPFRMDLSDPCIMVQGVCLPKTPYSMTARIFWAMIVPAGLVIIFVFGHEVWRRICPLSFFSQIPRALGIQRKKKIVSETGQTRYQLFSVDPDSWLGRNHLYLQFFLFFLGLNIRILFVNSDRLMLAAFLIFTICSAMLVGYLFAGKSWCQYFCPMAPVQMVYTGPRGLLDSQAHLGARASITQSMCREVDKSTGQEKSACVACQSLCIDVDSERSYWQQIEKPDRKLLYFGYLGLVIGFYFYYFLYAGNWEYYYSGAWTHEEGQLSNIFNPGWIIGGQAIAVPKILATPLSLAAFCGGAYALGSISESLYRGHLQKTGRDLPNKQILHRVFTLCTFISWNIFWMFGSRPNLAVLPVWLERTFTGLIIIVSGFWFAQTFWRKAEQYDRESVANALRRQLQKLGIDLSQFLPHGTDELKPDEVYVLAKVLPGFSRQSRIQVYQGVLQEALADGRTKSSTSLEMLQDVRSELQITPEEHQTILANLGVENPSLLDPHIQRSREDLLRLDSYQNRLESLLMDLIASHVSIEQALQEKQSQIDMMRLEYNITPTEQEQVLLALFHPDSALLSNSAILLGNLQIWSMRQKALTKLPSDPQAPIYRLLRSIVADQQRLIVAQLLNILELLADDPVAPEIARTTGLLAYPVVKELVTAHQPRLLPQIHQTLMTQCPTTAADIKTTPLSGGLHVTVISEKMSQITRIGSQSIPQISLTATLQDLLQEFDPLLQAASLHALNQVAPQLINHVAGNLDGVSQPLLQEVIDRVLLRPVVTTALTDPQEQPITTLEKLLWLTASPLFQSLSCPNLLAIARHSSLLVYSQGDVLCRAGAPASSLLLLIAGIAQSRNHKLVSGQIIGEVGILTKTTYCETVIASSPKVPALVIKAASFDDLLDREPQIARSLLVSISQRLQQPSEARHD